MLDFSDLKSEVDEMSVHIKKASEDRKFTYWFFRAYISEDDDLAKASVCGGPNDKSIDGVLIDDTMQTVYLVQSKYHQSINKKSDPMKEMTYFTDTLEKIASPHSAEFRDFVKDMEGTTANLVKKARNRIVNRKYSLKMIFVTTARRNITNIETVTKRVKHEAKVLKVNAKFQFFCGSDVIRLLQDYIDGVAPPIPEVRLSLEEDPNIRLQGLLQRFDEKNQIGSWIITMSGDRVADLYRKSGVRIFARNIRGFLGSSAKSINATIASSMNDEPDKFYYYNNGVTIICDHAEEISERGKRELLITNPQIINGQQTTRVLADSSRSKSKKVGVMVKIVQVPRETAREKKRFDELVSKIVAGTNRQNAISASDLVSNDRIQIELQRNLKPLNYIYLRKKQTKREAKEQYGSFGNHLINKDEFARASAATQLDQHDVRSGVNHLYKGEHYSVVFPVSDPLFYLPRYYLMRMVSRVSKGRPEWSYAKWMVIGFIWEKINSEINTKKSELAFTRAMEKHDKEFIRSLEKMVDQALRGAAKFYSLNRGTGKSRLDHSQFYRNRKGKNAEFGKFWNSKNNDRRDKLNRCLKEFRRIMAKL